MWSYRKRIERDLARWREAGWVTPEGEVAIRQDVEKGVRTLGLANSLAILSAVLIGFAVMSFVASNWQEMPRVLRLGMLLASLWASYGLAGALARRGMSGFAHAAILLGVAIFGGSIMLISQMYHMDGNVADAILLWAAGALLAGVVLRSNPALAFAMVLVTVWGTMEALRLDKVFWLFLIPWAIVAAAFYWQRWRPGIHLAGLALTGFVVSLGYRLNDGHAHGLVVAIGLGVMAASIAGERLRADLPALWAGVLNYGLVIVLAGLWALQFFESPPLDVFTLLAVLALAILIGAIFWGLKTGNRGALWLGYIGFSVEILAVYGETIGTLLDKSLFFLVAGLIVAGLAALAYRLHTRGEAQAKGALS
ncbi:DUF2157 domain-containing protein [Hyphomicrobium sp. LHD-15]|uniref:DUF2157 domain-containing protein n=1 Tax=Hyphomicrobium sp. LHD-15 TaxID=3072142 RepID=UPI00280C52CD|nr:DUF2157 domain-containing protein [Hyphomicrobium sp. LHD-15]MDQ8698294.1 DUF2157 domain-containing protein [Hyphomicrobium sp. LHD-15]